jgi:N-acetylmuramic acid 6-phosphate etherase
MATEDISARFVDLDAWPTADAVEAMYESQLSALAAVRPALGAIAQAADEAAATLKENGRLVYIGAGTSGRVGVQDGAELPPTFDWPRERLLFVMAGGLDALTASIEGAEDDEDEAERRVDAAGVGVGDVAIGVAASGTTPFTVAGLRRAAQRRAVTVAVANNDGAPLLAVAKHPILVETGVEVIAGSTRMKAGTAQKVVLNLLSTAIMLRLGRVHHGMMVQMRANNAKLRRRAKVMVTTIAGCDPATATAALEAAGGDIKRAAVIAAGAPGLQAAAGLLERHRGSLRGALSELNAGKRK